ncbi:hypothetical protein LOTGIDRAFT_228065 [Lottia gigantea]|uniref:Chloride channel CLIC-like protein 1 n=1 Tax=Lottia gigantea TaxID=225164 RepID=V4AMV0_LOTGI|nr:hypothetical protein LOTGIDRAFT_228065 [Lottia gigantea]ESP05509.1 hypothetical protein LOTGIDRAFT_228065 [Lottia gigantea]
MKFTVVVLILLVSPVFTEEKNDDDDIDPFDMLNFDHASMSMENKKVKKDNLLDKKKVKESAINKKEKREKEIPLPEKTEIKIEIPMESLSKEKPSSENQPVFDLRKCPIKKSPASPLFRQFVKTFLNHISKKVLYSGEYDMRLQLTVEDIEILKRYGESETEVDIYTAHTILTGMMYNFREVSTGDKSGHRLWIEEQLGFSLEKLVQIMIVVVLMAGICALFIYLKFSVKQLFIIVFVFLFFTSWLLTWYTLCKKEMSKQHYIISKEMPEYCKSRENQDAGFLSVTFSWFASPFRYEKDECLEYFEHLVINPYIKVSPVEALAVTLTRFTVAPLSHIAEELSKALRMFLKDLPVHIAPIAMIGLSVFGFLFLFMCFGYRVSSFLFTIGPGEQNIDGQLQALKEEIEKGREETKALILNQQKIPKDLQKYLNKTSQDPVIGHVPEQLTLPNHGDASSNTCSGAKSTFSKLEVIPSIDCNSETGVANSITEKDPSKTDPLNKNKVSAMASSNENGVVSNVNENRVVAAGNESRKGPDKNENVKGPNMNEKVSVRTETGVISSRNVNGEGSAKNENIEEPGFIEIGAVSDKNESGKPRPVQCTDNQVNGGIEEINLKKS